MYLITEIIYNKLEQTYKTVNGLYCYNVNGIYEEIDQFFGKSTIRESITITREDYIKDDLKTIIPYVTGYEVSDLLDGYKQIDYFIGKKDEIEGYIVKVKFCDRLETDGEKIFGRYCSEIIVVLRNGNFLEINDKIVRVIDNKLFMTI